MTPTIPKRLFCFGLGYSALRFARQLQAAGTEIAGTCRSDAKAAALRAEGMEVHVFDTDRPLRNFTRAVGAAEAILVSIPPVEAGDRVLASHGQDLARAGSRLRWLGYLSTTGVYGNRDGGWVDETAALLPVSARGRHRVAAEAVWRNLWQQHGLPVHVFRLAGIYGPGRNPLVAHQAGRAQRIVKPGQVFSRIHVDDIAAVLMASLHRPDPGAIYNVCDDAPSPPQDVVAYAAGLLNQPPPPEIPFDAAELSPLSRSFYGESKRVANRRIREELGVILRYPSYREGLRALACDLGQSQQFGQSPA